MRPADVATGVIIGRTSEYFDFFVYAIASVLVFPKWVFPYASPLNATLYSFVVFAIGFLARPIGDAIFLSGRTGLGPRRETDSRTFSHGRLHRFARFLPGYAQVGWVSALILAILRICQCMAFGAFGMVCRRCSPSTRQKSNAAGTR